MLEILKKVCKENNLVLLDYENGQKIIDILSYKEFSNRTKGFCVGYKSKTLIFYDNNLSDLDKQLTIAHELGHAMFDFVDGGETFDERQKQKIGDMSMSEFFAEIFACVMLAGYTLHKNL